MKYVIGIDLGTSAVKILLVNQRGDVIQERSKSYPLFQERSGYSEQNPKDWLDQTILGLSDLIRHFDGEVEDIEGISFSGQMHGLVLLDKNYQVLRNAILWNDTRTTKECQQIYAKVGKERLLKITKNLALEGFTLPKILWVKNNEPDIFQKATKFLLPKDYLRYQLTGKLHMEYSDAAGTLLFNISEKKWSKEICELLEIDMDLCPPLIESYHEVGTISLEIAQKTGLSPSTRVFAGGADNACGAIGAGILENGKTMLSIGTSGVVLTYEENAEQDFQGKVHYFNHSVPDGFYSMGVTLSAGHSLDWFKNVFAPEEDFNEFLEDIDTVPAGSNGLLFTPYISGERTPHVDANIRGSFIGMDHSHRRKHFIRAVLEGITFSLKESIEIFRKNAKEINSIISIGGGARNPIWLQMQADIFNTKIIKLKSEQGPAMGAAMIAAVGCGWFDNLQECAQTFIQVDKVYYPIQEHVEQYKKIFPLYKNVYFTTKTLSKELMKFK
ncbi:xylulokinase [Garciella nitratireducens]|uniref:xylulokinase n=1 Tax=Garciella nitratireducens TaxID=218205 RepID=UPI000DEA0E5E|nr:xylulokinase [Garciella nitratireducens]RBP37989.1 xylulokinase [Garciella nitratireducens]